MISYLYDFLMRSHFGLNEWLGRIENDSVCFCDHTQCNHLHRCVSDDVQSNRGMTTMNLDVDGRAQLNRKLKSLTTWRFMPDIGGWPNRPWFSIPLLAGKWWLPPRLLHGEIEAGRLKAYRVGQSYRVNFENAVQYEQAYIVGQEVPQCRD